ncbi:uncharacterized protein LOC131860176 [Cryptomeria japonica]|uniref:uncharacterized protein LOC131860176 n=1 Tax=Cryptomeria japonica TaxID=3369 RepID=UPI0027DA7039|nr:uncharacterized protein LOC131860176 [Cryptomeria japonica]
MESSQPNWPSQQTASLFDPCMADTNQILSIDPLFDYEELVNVVQRHTKCSAHTWLKKKGCSTLHCCYKAPWPEQDFSTLIVDAANNPSYEPTRNDNRLNIHSPIMLAIWRSNIDCQPVCSKMAVIQYISKYAAKTKQKSVGYVDILKKIVATTNTQDTILLTYQKFMMGIVADRDISAQETCHMLQKLPLISCSRHFVSLNVSRKALHRIAEQNDNAELSKSYISTYMERSIELESISLIQSTQQFSYNTQQKKHQWQKLQKQAIVNVYPHFKTSPPEVDDNFEAYCWSELLLYKPFRNIPTDIRTSPAQIIANWKLLCIHGYTRWHIYGIEHECKTENDIDSNGDTFLYSHNEDQYEWEYLSQMGASNKINVNDLQMLGRRDYDINFDWHAPYPTDPLHHTVVTFISTNKINCQPSILEPTSPPTTSFPLASKQKIALELILAH